MGGCRIVNPGPRMFGGYAEVEVLHELRVELKNEVGDL